ncbi:YafY family protein [Micromonospora taraxaci]|uniref:Putative DNA-binding transcriptional regulator YafY n=1 Tax=Micromonospora taraxaci TaxID=1316803 RepID=A0A561VZR7_9ACTN|nr:YafY family protein [Micromonospora taraxaci]TWG17097.1 putative DNA-binding transcriptional regulator YafY [Micromonospora taraxaci]
MLETSARLLRLLSLLQTPRDWTGAQLAERLGVSGRTVRTDVERLRTLGYPVTATRGSVGGYRLGAGASLPPLLLDDEEAVAVTVGLRIAAGGTISGIEEASLRALAKLEQVLPARLRRRVAALQTYTVAVPRDVAGPVVDPTLLSVLAAACREREGLRFDYADHAGTGSRRDVEPYRLVNWGRRWYLLAYDLGRADWRTFRVDRITLRTPNNPRFAARPLPTDDIAGYVSGRVSAASWRYRARIIVHAPAVEVANRITPAVGTVEPIDERTCVLDTGAESVETLAVHLGLLDHDFTVTEPPELVAYLRRLARRYAISVPGGASPPGPAPPTPGRADPARG